MKRIVLLFLMIVPFSLAAQKDFRPGYLVLNSGDTLKGYMLYQSAGKIKDQCYYRQSPKAETKTYHANDVLGYVITRDKYYSSIYLDSLKQQKYFVEKLVTGRVSLYRFQNSFYAEKDKVYSLANKIGVVNDQNVLYQHDYKTYAGILNYLFLDCQSMGGKAYNATLAEKPLADLAIEYSKCWNAPYTDYKQFKPSQVISYYAFSGITSSSLSFTSDQYHMITVKRTDLTSVSPVLGLGVQLMQPRSLEKIALSAELIFSNHLFHQDAKSRFNGQDIEEDINVRYNRIRIPLSMKILFNTGSSSPYLRLGYLMNVYFSGKLDVDQVKTLANDPSSETRRSESYKITNLPIGQFWGAAGFQKRIGRLTFFTEFRVEAIGGKGNSGVTQTGGGNATVMDPKSVTSTTMNGLIGVAF